MTISRKTSHRCDLLCPVAHIMRGAPSFVDPESTLRSVTQAMVAQGNGVAVVLGPKGPSSIVTESDIVRVLAQRADPDTTWVADVASDLIAVSPTVTVLEGIRQMAGKHIRHVPVTEKGEIVGLVVSEDVLDLIASKSSDVE
jgi:signal-transduction protein with cAMP-binding, CBS, and nucleotidyltransferase domain